jgi:RNA polymerase sigma factor (TIGR02999 family)
MNESPSAAPPPELVVGPLDVGESPTPSLPPPAYSGQGADTLFTALYDELRRLARRELWRNGVRDILGTTTLVHEVWLDISGRPSLAFEDDGRFLAYAARTMRGLVIDRVRARSAQKRGGDMIITSLDANTAEQVSEPEHLQQISDALDELASLEPDLARVVDLKFFCGFTLAEVATMQGVTERTVQRQWKRARLLLYHAMREE